MNNNAVTELLGIDFGSSRIGLARINTFARFAEPLPMLSVAEKDPLEELVLYLTTHEFDAVVVGLPRGLDGQDTQQTVTTQEFAKKLQSRLTQKVYMIDEAGSTKLAAERKSSGEQGDEDSLAACVILEDIVAQPDISLFEVKA